MPSVAAGEEDHERDVLVSVCFYCKGERVSICVCLDCKTKFELAQLDLTRLKKDQEIRKANYWKGVKAKSRKR